MNAKISMFVICLEEIMYLLLYNLHECTFKTFSPFLENSFHICHFKDDSNLDGVIASLNIMKYPAKKSLLSLRIFTGISVF